MEVCPFRGIRYSQSIIGDVARVICPPYDVITPQQQRLYYKKSDYNAIRLEFPEPTGDRYQKAATTFRQWLEQGVLQRDDVSSFYLHEHRFKYSGKKKMRCGVIARVRLEPWGSGIFPHEETSSRDKSDRLQLMQTCRANFSPLFSLYQDSGRRIASILSQVAEGKPLASSRAGRSSLPDSDEAHSLWAVTDREIKRELGELLSSQPIYVADGHHRYETALTYLEERRRERSSGSKGTPDYVMMELVDFSDPGLVVLPLHRLVRGIASSNWSGLEDQLGKFFSVESVPLEEGGWALPVGSCLGILGLQPGSVLVLRRREDVYLEALMPASRSQAYREFGISILNHIILDKVLSGAGNLDIGYSVDLKEIRDQVKGGKYQLAFLLHPPRPEMVKAFADARDRMPRKSTYFYPKLPTGLVINSLD
jgi:uncharacterized protein (DUF1015 family)